VNAAQRTRRRQREEELCAAAIRALTGDPELCYRGRRLHQGLRPVPVLAPHLRGDLLEDDFVAARGAADAVGLRLRLSDPGLHRSLSPEDPVERLVFELLEQLRVESLAPPEMPGLAHNLQHRFQAWSQGFHDSGLTDTGLGILIFTVSQMCWSRLTGKPLGEPVEDLMELTRGALAPVIGHGLAGIRRHRRDQRAFAPHALEIARAVGEMVRHAQADEPETAAADDEREQNAFRLLLDFETREDAPAPIAATGHSKILEDSPQGYRVYTSRYDREAPAASLLRPALLQEYRGRLDRRIADLGIQVGRLARLFMAVLSVPRRDGWDFGQEQGYIDGRRLAQLISSPSERRLFRLEQHKPDTDCVVSVLIDCSGSMKEHIEPVAALVDILARALEQAGARTEVLGFTTGAWNGGRSRQDWLARGRPRHPGRLNETLHMVFKDAGRSWRRARAGIAALLKADLFREGVDGEAVEWACRRLNARPENRRILIVVSDGSPMDTSTNLANDPYYLDNHLKQVVARHEQLRDVEILGLGVGLDLSPYYRRNLAADLSKSIDNALFLEIVQLIAGRHRS